MLVRYCTSIAKSLTSPANRTRPVGVACSVESGTGLRARTFECDSCRAPAVRTALSEVRREREVRV